MVDSPRPPSDRLLENRRGSPAKDAADTNSAELIAKFFKNQCLRIDSGEL
jgi:hypothetical protein